MITHLNQQRYLQSATLRLEEWRIRRTDTKQCMHHRQLLPELKQSIRQYDQYKWLATRGVDEETLLNGLPRTLERDQAPSMPLFSSKSKLYQ